MAADLRANLAIVETDIPARLDRLPWGRFHTLVVAALDALEREFHDLLNQPTRSAA